MNTVLRTLIGHVDSNRVRCVVDAGTDSCAA